MASKQQFTLKSFCARLTEENRQSHRAAFLHFFNTLAGQTVVVSLATGRVVSGQYYAGTPYEGHEFRIVIKNVKDNAQGEDGEVVPNISFLQSEIVSLTVAGLDLSSKAELMTDAVVQKKDLSHLSGRELQAASAWLLDPSTSTNMDANGSIDKNWNQFEVNQRLFNVKGSYDESLYTSKLDMSRLSKEQLDHADRVAKEIEGQLTDNIHLQEERGHLQEREMDEEEMYSGVIRSPDKSSDKSGPGGAWKKGLKISPAPGLAQVKKAAGKPDASDSALEGSWRKRSPAGTISPTVTASSSSPKAVVVDDAESAPPGFTADANTKTEPANDAPATASVLSSETVEPTVETVESSAAASETPEKPKEPAPDTPAAKSSKLNPKAASFVPTFSMTPPAALSENNFVPQNPVPMQMQHAPFVQYTPNGPMMQPVPQMYGQFPPNVQIIGTNQFLPMQPGMQGMPMHVPYFPMAPDGELRPQQQQEAMYQQVLGGAMPMQGSPGFAPHMMFTDPYGNMFHQQQPVYQNHPGGMPMPAMQPIMSGGGRVQGQYQPQGSQPANSPYYSMNRNNNMNNNGSNNNNNYRSGPRPASNYNNRGPYSSPRVQPSSPGSSTPSSTPVTQTTPSPGVSLPIAADIVSQGNDNDAVAALTNDDGAAATSSQ